MTANRNHLAAQLAVSVIAGASCGLAICWAAAAFECSVISKWDGTGRMLCDAPGLASGYAIGSIYLGALCGVLDFAMSAFRRKAGRWPANAVLWTIIATTIFGPLVVIGGWPRLGAGQKSVMLLSCCCFGATFGATISIATQAGSWIRARRHCRTSLTRRAKAGVASVAAVLVLACYVGSFFAIRKPLTVTRFAEGPIPASGHVKFVDTLTYFYSKTGDRENFLLWYVYWPLARVSGMDDRPLADRLAEPADAQHNGPLPTYVRDLNDLRAACPGFFSF